ncbi:MAG TPA: SemiSWEET transporter [Methanomassiliicoccales archaeon]|nr:SemiSWEET transporter [Methanomassiliicoccales archaeon]
MSVLLGLTAGFITTMGFVPQVIKGYRTGSMKDVSLTMPVLLMVGLSLWLLYGLVIQDLPVILWNAVAMILNGTLVLLKVRSIRLERA